jgi:hypothetical protein
LLIRNSYAHRHAWVVSKRDGLPTGYAPAECDPRLPGAGPAIDTAAALRRWLAGLR